MTGPFWLVLAGIGLLYFLGSIGGETESPLSQRPPRPELLSVDVRKQCSDLIQKAMDDSVITKRPSANRIEIADATWALIDADTKRNTMAAVACDAFGKKAEDLDLSQYIVVYGATSGKRMAMLTSVGVQFD